MWRFWSVSERTRTFQTELVANALFLVKWLAFAYLLQALLITYVPAEAIGSLVGGEGFLSIVIGAVVGAPAYLNGYAAPALVAGLMEQGMSSGAAMAAVWSLVKRTVFFAYVGFGLGGAIVFGAVFAEIVS